MPSTAFNDGLASGFGALETQLTEIIDGFGSDFVPGFLGTLLEFAVIFLAVWGTWVGIRAVLRAGRLVK